MFTLYKLCLSVEAGERQRRWGDATERSRADLSRRESHARSGPCGFTGYRQGASRLG